MRTRYAPHTVRDALSFEGDPAPARHAIVRAVAANQDERPHVQLLAVAGALVVMAEAIGVEPVDIIERVRRVREHIDSPYARQWQGLSEYARGELLK